MKRCATCKEEKPFDDFHRYSRSKDGLQAACKSCMIEAVTKWQRANTDRVRKISKKFKKSHPEQNRAHVKVRAAIKSGELKKPDQCEHCNSSDVFLEGHHHDYSKPLDVTWLCRTCHMKEHVRLNILNETQNSKHTNLDRHLR